MHERAFRLIGRTALGLAALLAACDARQAAPDAESPDAAPTSTAPPVADPAPPPASPSAPTTVTLGPAGYDTIRIGATPAEAGYGLADDGSYRDVCRIYLSERLPGMAVMVEKGRIRRVTLHTARAGRSPIRTDRGIGVGSTEAAVRAAYRPLGEEPHKYSDPPAKNLYWGEEGVPQALRFEIGSDGRVAELHAGESPWLGYVEGCS